METIEAPRLRVGLPLLFQALEKSQPRRFTIIVPSVGKITASSGYHHCSKRWQNHSLVGLPSLFHALEKITAPSGYYLHLLLSSLVQTLRSELYERERELWTGLRRCRCCR